jgi:hypothetical protein
MPFQITESPIPIKNSSSRSKYTGSAPNPETLNPVDGPYDPPIIYPGDAAGSTTEILKVNPHDAGSAAGLTTSPIPVRAGNRTGSLTGQAGSAPVITDPSGDLGPITDAGGKAHDAGKGSGLTIKPIPIRAGSKPPA